MNTDNKVVTELCLLQPSTFMFYFFILLIWNRLMGCVMKDITTYNLFSLGITVCDIISKDL